MTNKTKYIGGPKSKETKVISSRNSTTHGLTSRHWQNSKEQDLYNENIVELVKDFDPQTHIERMLISKLAECTVRLMRIQQVENALFDLASSEAEHPDEVIKSLDHDNSDSKLIKAMQAAALDLLDKNIPLEKIMLRGGWKSETSAMRYLQSWSDQNWTLV